MREQFINAVKEVLTGYGFNESNGQFERVQFFTQPGQQMIINGQAFNQPDQQIEVKHVVREFGDGYYENLDGSGRVDMTTFEFQVWIKNEIQGQLSSTYAWDDIESFKKDLEHILRV